MNKMKSILIISLIFAFFISLFSCKSKEINFEILYFDLSKYSLKQNPLIINTLADSYHFSAFYDLKYEQYFNELFLETHTIIVFTENQRFFDISKLNYSGTTLTIKGAYYTYEVPPLPGDLRPYGGNILIIEKLILTKLLRIIQK